VRTRAAIAGLVLAAAISQPAAAQPAETGAEALDRRDFARAAELWRAEAAAGSAEAKFALGQLNDLGLGTPRDEAKALRWYLEAAEAGLPEAQFNVAVMMDAGTGVPRDLAAAAVWYAHAAAQGHPRAAYNLGLLYEGGEGVPHNPDLARFWLARAAETLPAAAERLAALPPTAAGDRRLEAPAALATSLVAGGDERTGALVWSAAPGPAGAHFLVEIAELPTGPETWGPLLVTETTEAPLVIASLSGPEAPYAWRVVTIDPSTRRYAAADWQPLSGSADTGLPHGRVTIRIGAHDAAAKRFAQELAVGFFRARLWARIALDAAPAPVTDVRYSFAEDARLAGDIAGFLPQLTSTDAAFAPDLDAAPGEIVVRLVGGPAEGEPASVASNQVPEPRRN